MAGLFDNESKVIPTIKHMVAYVRRALYGGR